MRLSIHLKKSIKFGSKANTISPPNTKRLNGVKSIDNKIEKKDEKKVEKKGKAKSPPNIKLVKNIIMAVSSVSMNATLIIATGQHDTMLLLSLVSSKIRN